MNARQIFEATGDASTPLDVICISGSAAYNAAASINENGGRFVQGEFTDEFIGIWLAVVRGTLSDDACEWNSQEAVEWFAVRGLVA